MKADDATKRPTLADAQKIAKARTVVHRPSDFLTESEQAELAEQASKPAHRRRLFDDFDAVGAEIMARFGYDAYKAWLNEEISMEQMGKFLNAERARDAQKTLPGMALAVCIGGSCARPRNKHGGTPKGLQNAQKIIKTQEKIAKGGKL